MSLRILIADDESIIRMDLREALTQMGHQVIGEAGDGLDAVAKTHSLDPDLVFLDIKMPQMDGLEALRRMNEEKLRPVIILTAYNDRKLVDQAVELGAKAYIVKPFQDSTLMPAIELATAHFDQLQALQKENASLKETIEAGKKVQRAKALLMKHEGLSEPQAFRKIQKMSMEKNRKMDEIADAIILIHGTS